MDDRLRDRARGALTGLAVGDALGMPTQTLPLATVRARYGVLDGFRPGPDDNAISRGLPAGRVTDDTDQAVLLGELLVAGGGELDPHAFARALAEWEGRMRAAGSLDLLGPSTRRALDRLAAGVPVARAGRGGDTNGAAMRIAPVGVAVPAAPLGRLVDAVRRASMVTHNTGVAIAGAAAVAAAVSAGLAGASLPESLRLAVAAARLGGRAGPERGDPDAAAPAGAHPAAPGPAGAEPAGADVAARLQRALDLVAARDPATPLDAVARAVAGELGTGVATRESVPTALAVAALFPDDPWTACRHAASLGGDSDTVAAMTGAVVGAHAGATALPAAVPARLAAANPGLRLDPLADALLALRARAGGVRRG